MKKVYQNSKITNEGDICTKNVILLKDCAKFLRIYDVIWRYISNYYLKTKQKKDKITYLHLKKNKQKK